MTPVERIEYMLKMESIKPKKDEAGVYIPGGMDSAVKCKAYEECLKVLRGKDDKA